MLAKNKTNLVWIDCEFSDLSPNKGRILEAVVIVTDAQMKVRIEGPVLAVYQDSATLDAMDSWNRGTHGRSGLLIRVRNSTMEEMDVEEKILSFLKEYVPAGASPMCGNVLGLDRKFLAKYMPRLHDYFHYSDFDANVFEIAAKLWKPELKLFEKDNAHTALADVHESIDKMSYYRKAMLR